MATCKGVLVSRPAIKYIQVQGSSICDGKCKICPYSQSPVAKLRRTMSMSEFRLVLEKIYEHVKQPQLFCPYLMSDPIYDKLLFERIPMIFEFFPDTLLEISTSMSAHDPDYYKELVDILEGRRVRFIISLHGINEETYKVISSRNFKEIVERVVSFLKIADGKLTNIRFAGLGQSRDGAVKLFTPQEYCNFIYELVRKANLKFVSSIQPYSHPFHNRAGLVKWQNQIEFRRHIDAFHPHFCCRPYEWLHVLADGRVISCCMNYALDQVWGNLFVQSLEEIWRGEKRKSYILRQLGLEQGEIPCKYCMSPGG